MAGRPGTGSACALAVDIGLSVGSVSAEMRSPVARVTARSMRFSSSRTLPGKLCPMMAAIASGSIPDSGRPCSALNLRKK
ncbi:MAG TPA: hypothetical protein VGF45_02035 [Polyangia bacterium]